MTNLSSFSFLSNLAEDLYLEYPAFYSSLHLDNTQTLNP